MLGAAPLAAIMNAARLAEGAQAKNLRSRAARAADSLVSHSQITSDDQPCALSAASEAESRATFRAIFADQ